MSKNRKSTNLVHKKGKEIFDISKHKTTGVFYIKGTDIEVPKNKLSHKKPINDKSNYDFKKPYQGQDLGDEWDDYPWSADDF
jgi:hypothetical protein